MTYRGLLKSNGEIAMIARKKILYYILYPFVYTWFGLCWLIMKTGRGIYWFGNMLSGFRLDPYEWTEEI